MKDVWLGIKMTKNLRVLLGATILATLSAGVASAADLMVDVPADVSPAASDMRGTIEVGVFAEYVDQEDDTFSGFAPGGFISGSLWGGSDTFVWGIDGLFERNTFTGDGATYDEAPLYVGILGGHLGMGDASQSFGGFVAVAATPDDDDEVRAGVSAGIEGNTTMDNMGLFGQLGYAHVTTDDNGEGFHGFFIHGGAVYSVSDDTAVMADAGLGYAPDDFEDIGSDEHGVFATLGVKAAFKLPTDFNAFLTLGYEAGYYNAVEDEDVGVSHTFKVGLSMPFGADSTAASALNAQQTYAGPFRAGSWAQTLD